MKIGIDLDNTLICYEDLFGQVARREKLISAETPDSKVEVKRAVIARHGPHAWTWLQARVYGPDMVAAEPFPGAEEALLTLLREGHSLCILSHKTRYAARAPAIDLHASALSWMEARGWFSDHGLGLNRMQVEFFPTRAEKVRAISDHRCDWFVDDLIEVFAEPHFPTRTRPVLFEPAPSAFPHAPYLTLRRWSDLSGVLGLAVAA